MSKLALRSELRLTLRDRVHLHLNLRQSQNIRRSRHRAQNIGENILRSRSCENTERTDHEILEGPVGRTVP